jgi:hypothetical protein
MMRLAVEEARMPSLSSFAPRLKPGVSVGTRKALMPLCLSDLEEGAEGSGWGRMGEKW